jgi:hypothetical protein
VTFSLCINAKTYLIFITNNVLHPNACTITADAVLYSTSKQGGSLWDILKKPFYAQFYSQLPQAQYGPQISMKSVAVFRTASISGRTTGSAISTSSFSETL